MNKKMRNILALGLVVALLLVGMGNVLYAQNGNKPKVTIRAGSKEKPYDGYPLTEDSYSVDGLPSDHTLTGVVVEGTITDVGSENNVAKGGKIWKRELKISIFPPWIWYEDVDVTKNFDIEYVNGILKVTALDVTIDVEDAEKVYGEDDPDFEGTVTGLLAGDNLGTITYFREGTDEDAGKYEEVLNASFTSNPNYKVTVNKGDFTVNPLEATITVDDAQKVYGNSDPAFTGTVTGLLAGDDLGTITYFREGEGTDEDAGKYEEVLDADFTSNPNYKVTVNKGDFTVTLRPVTISASIAARLYDGTLFTAQTCLASGLVPGHKLASVDVSGALIDVGVMDNIPSGAVIEDGDKNDVTDNYDISYVKGELTVLPRSVTITANSASQPYDGKALTDDGYVYDPNDLVSGHVLTSVDIAGSQTNVGKSDNVASNAVVKTGSDELPPVTAFSTLGSYALDVSHNYTFTYVSGVLEVTPRPVTITVDDASKVFGEVDPAFTGTVVGLVEGDDLGVNYVRTNTAAEAVGEYPGVLDATYTPDDNYIVTVIQGDFEITETLVAGDEDEPKETVKGDEDTKAPATGQGVSFYLYIGILLVLLSALAVVFGKRAFKKQD